MNRYNIKFGKNMDELLMKYIKGETTPEEREKVVRWLDEDPEHMHQYRSLRKL
mgnify:FL=1